MQFILPALALGFLSSFHCVGMCGPIALAIPVNRRHWYTKWLGIITYNFGRVFTYFLLGILFGLIGKGFAIAGYQQSFSIVLGFIILIMILFPYHKFANRNVAVFNFLTSFISKLKAQLAFLFRQKSYPSLFLIGTLNGLLPCGLVYLGIVAAMVLGNFLNGGLFMVFFGLGTFPAMLSVSLLSNSIGVGVRNKIRKAVPIFVATMAVMLILRGMNLGIPYLSPKISSDGNTVKSCCHKN